jgi:hypothetical protein
MCIHLHVIIEKEPILVLDSEGSPKRMESQRQPFPSVPQIQVGMCGNSLHLALDDYIYTGYPT